MIQLWRCVVVASRVTLGGHPNAISLKDFKVRSGNNLTYNCFITESGRTPWPQKYFVVFQLYQKFPSVRSYFSAEIYYKAGHFCQDSSMSRTSETRLYWILEAEWSHFSTSHFKRRFWDLSVDFELRFPDIFSHTQRWPSSRKRRSRNDLASLSDPTKAM